MSGDASGVVSGSWTLLVPGQSVELLLDGVSHFRGVVDVMTDSSEIIWLVDPLGERRMFHAGEDYVAKILGPQLNES